MLLWTDGNRCVVVGGAGVKKTFRILLAIVLSAFVVISCVACSSSGKVSAVEKTTGVFTEDSMAKSIDDFLGSGDNTRRDRTAFGNGEKAAAQYIFEALSGYGYDDGKTLETQAISAEITNSYGTETKSLYSQNVIATYNEGKSKIVVIGANYDNLYSDIEDAGVTGDGGEGVLCNSTGVATLLEIARAYKELSPSLDYTVKFAFFGAGEVGSFGSGKFVTDYLNGGANVLLAVNLYGLAGEKVEVYADETDTLHDELFVKSGEKYDTAIERLSRTTPLFPQRYADNLNYSHIGLISSHVSFFEKNVPSVNIFGGEYDGFSYRNYKPDSLDSFRRDFANYAKMMADVASLVYGVTVSTEFAELAPSFGSDKFDYSFFTESLYADLALLGAVVLLGIVLMVVVNALNKSKPDDNDKRKVKIAVFGMDYEEKTDNVIYVDVFPKDASEQNDDDGNDKPLDPFD